MANAGKQNSKCSQMFKVYIAIVGTMFLLVLAIMQKQDIISNVRILAPQLPKGLRSYIPINEHLHHISQTTSQSTVSKSSVVMVLVLTYMRSGSSLTGDILQHSPEAFYIYEPFRALGHQNQSSFIITYANGTKQFPPYSYHSVMKNILFNWFTCNIGGIPNIGLLDSFLWKGLKSSIYPLCLRDYKNRTRSSRRLLKICRDILQEECKRSPTRIIKTIRAPMAVAEDLLEQLPSLKIVHVVRDPRAVLLSQGRFGMCNSKRGGRYGCTSKYCTAVENNILTFERLRAKHPKQLLHVYYEDIAREPLNTSRKIFEYIGATMTSQARDYIYNITLAGNPSNCAICTMRSNSSEHIDTWKQKISPDFLNVINERCNFVIKRYGYDIR